MFHFLFLLPAWTTFGHRPRPGCEVQLTSSAMVRTRWLIEDGVARPTVRLARSLRTLRGKPRTRADRALARVFGETFLRSGDMVRLGQLVTQLSHGFQALELECADVPRAFETLGPEVHAAIARAESTLNDWDEYLTRLSGRDLTWAWQRLDRVDRHIAEVRARCVLLQREVAE